MSQLTPTDAHIPANGSHSLPDVLLERNRPPATLVCLRKIPKGGNFWISVHTVMPGHQQNGPWYLLWFALFWHTNSGPYKQVKQCRYVHTSAQSDVLYMELITSLQVFVGNSEKSSCNFFCLSLKRKPNSFWTGVRVSAPNWIHCSELNQCKLYVKDKMLNAFCCILLVSSSLHAVNPYFIISEIPRAAGIMIN